MWGLNKDKSFVLVPKTWFLLQELFDFTCFPMKLKLDLYPMLLFMRQWHFHRFRSWITWVYLYLGIYSWNFQILRWLWMFCYQSMNFEMLKSWDSYYELFSHTSIEMIESFLRWLLSMKFKYDFWCIKALYFES